MSLIQPLIELRHVSVALNGRRILHDLNWQLRPNEHWMVLGDNGSGKSTFLRLLRAEIAPVPDGGQRIYTLDSDPQTSGAGIREQVALVSPELQERYLQREGRLTAEQVIETGFLGTDYLLQKLSAVQKASVRSTIELLALEPLLPRDVRELSSGELRQVLIARALVSRPRILICDEICDGLDALAREHLLRRLGRVPKSGTQLLYTTHRPEERIPALTHALVFDAGRVVAQGLAATAASNQVFSRPPATVFTGQTGAAADRALPPVSKPNTWIKPEAPRSSGPLIQIKRADVYLNRRRVLHAIEWEIQPGEHWAVLGPNGAGKSTLLKLLAGDVHPALGGQVQRFAFTSKNTIWQLRRRLGCISPELQAHYRERLTAAEVVASGFFSSVGLLGRVNSRQRARVRALMSWLGLRELANRSALQLSYGEFRKVLLARALVHGPSLLICDEPLDGLDAGARQEMREVLEQVASQGTNLIVVTHHPGDLPACITHVLRLDAGRIVSKEAL